MLQSPARRVACAAGLFHQPEEAVAKVRRTDGKPARQIAHAGHRRWSRFNEPAQEFKQGLRIPAVGIVKRQCGRTADGLTILIQARNLPIAQEQGFRFCAHLLPLRSVVPCPLRRVNDNARRFQLGVADLMGFPGAYMQRGKIWPAAPQAAFTDQAQMSKISVLHQGREQIIDWRRQLRFGLTRNCGGIDCMHVPVIALGKRSNISHFSSPNFPFACTLQSASHTPQPDRSRCDALVHVQRPCVFGNIADAVTFVQHYPRPGPCRTGPLAS
ncbi:MAG: hypothetical protein ACRES9_05790 [Gammaproteobacteria bacterium]